MLTKQTSDPPDETTERLWLEYLEWLDEQEQTTYYDISEENEKEEEE